MKPSTNVLPVFLALAAAFSSASAATYTWELASGGDFAVAANWNPDRLAPAADDVLVFDGTATPGALAITNVQAQTIGQLQLANSAIVNLASTANVDLNIAGLAGDDLVVPAGSALRLTGAFRVAILLPASTTGLVGGDVIFNATAASVAHRILVTDVGALVFQNGSSAAMAPTTTGAGSGFGTSTAPTSTDGAVIFQSGSAFYQGGEKDGTRNGGTGSAPFATTASKVVFQSGCSYICWEGIASASNRTYGNFVWRAGASQANTGTGPMVVHNNFECRNSGIVSQGIFGLSGYTGPISIGGDLIIEAAGTGLNLAAAPAAPRDIAVAGNVDIQDASLFTEPVNANNVFLFNGAVSQNLNFSGDVLPTVTLDNAAGAILTGDLGVSGALTLTNGNFTVGANTLTLGSAAVVTGPGKIIGEITRNVDATVLTTHAFPVDSNPVSIELTAAGTGTGTVAVNTASGAGASLPVGSTGIARTWSISPTGASGFTATVVFTYSDGELNGADEADLQAARFNGVSWDLMGGTVDTIANTVTVTGITEFSSWTLLDATTDVQDWQNFRD